LLPWRGQSLSFSENSAHCGELLRVRLGCGEERGRRLVGIRLVSAFTEEDGAGGTQQDFDIHPG